MKFYREFSRQMWSRYGTMFPITHLPRCGYSSLYAVSEEDARIIQNEGHSRNRDRFKVYSDTLYMDFDDGDATLWNALPKLLELNAPLKIYFSGKKGYHVALPIQPMYGHNVPEFQKVFVTKLGIACDHSLYQHGRLFSNPGRVHPKTGVPKHLILELFEGEALKIPEFIVVEKKKKIDLEKDIDHLRFGLMRLLQLIANEPMIGDRHTGIWGCATTLRDAGLSEEAALEILSMVNESWKNSKDPEEIEAAVTQGYK